MSCRTLAASLSLIVIIISMQYSLSHQSAGGEDDKEPIFTWCFYSTNSTSPLFHTNLNSLLSNLTTQAPLNITTYATATADGLFGFAQCMSAADADDCRTCLARSAADIVRGCPGKSHAMVLHLNCILHYSNESFLAQIQPDVIMKTTSGNDTAEPTEFNEQLSKLLLGLTSRAGDGGGNDSKPGSRFAVDMTRYGGGSGRIYGMAQCTRDLSGKDCFLCLQEAAGEIPECCQNKEGSGLYSASCGIRFDKYAFSPAFRSLVQLDRVPPSSPPSKIDPTTSDKKGSKSHGKVLGAAIGVITSLILLFAIGFIGFARKKRGKRKGGAMLEEMDDSKSVLFHLHVLKAATDDFAEANKLGQGGFGSVYKGTLSDGQEIAVKRLLATSNQGMEELITEVALVAKLQHRNLVKLLGCCLEKQEKLLVYEYVPNNSLEKLLFDPIRNSELRWVQRYKIIRGIAKGLLYLHEESRLKIIHRDLKASNILLDANLVPKISDFGLAKIVSADQTQGNTGQVAGTFGYMAPEYVMNGNFSTKSDVFSFGVLILEIITGRKNSDFSEVEGAIDLLGLVWRHRTDEGSMRNLIDEKLRGEYHVVEASRCIHIGLLCVQQDAGKRPNMSTVVIMLSSFSITLPIPSPPAFCAHYFPSIDIASFQSSGVRTGHTSLYEASITELDSR